MPIFEFQCAKCNTIFSKFVKNNNDSYICEKCNSKAEKIISTPNWSIKGSCVNPTAPREEKEKSEEKNEDFKALWEFKCEKCGEVDERYIYFSEKDNQYCDKCKSKMDELISNVRYELIYDPKKDICNWKGESSQYWKEVKKQRREGKDVKGLKEK